MKKLIRAIESYRCSGLDLVDILKYECETNQARAASFEGGVTSRIGIYLEFWENQSIRKFPRDCWSERTHNGYLVRTRWHFKSEGTSEVWVKGKPHAIYINKGRKLSPVIKSLIRKYGLEIKVN